MAGKAGYKGVLTLIAGPTIVANAQDVELSVSASTAETTSRASAGWKEFVQSLKEFELSAGHLWVPTDAAYILLRDALLNGTILAFKHLDEEGYGFSGSLIVTGLKNPQSLGDAITVPFTCKGTGALVAVTPP